MGARRDNVRLGREGETAAAAHLESMGYRLVARNVRYRHGEIDLVAMDGETLVFVEVKTRTGQGYGLPAESVTHRKQCQLIRLAETFLAGWTGRYAGCRFDVVAVRPSGLGGWTCEVIQDAFARWG